MKFLHPLLAFALLLAACGAPSETASTAGESDAEAPAERTPTHSVDVSAEGLQHASIYEVNLRQYTEEGTFAAFAQHLPRLKELGVDILWFMPIYPIGEKERKGTLGSYYAVKDYKAVNPEHGTMEEF